MSLSRYFRPKEELKSSGGKIDLNKVINWSNNSIHSSTNEIAIVEVNETMALPTTPAGNAPISSIESDVILDSVNRQNVVDPNFPPILAVRDGASSPSTEVLVIHPVVVIDTGKDVDNVSENTNEQRQMKSTTATVNRFSKWAYHSEKNDDNTSNAILLLEPSNVFTNTVPLVKRQHCTVDPKSRRNVREHTVVGKKRQKLVIRSSETTTTLSGRSQCVKKEFVPMKDLSVSEQQSEMEKWHSITTLFTPPDVDVPYTIEDRRYHMVLATLLHTRCQEPSVRVAIIQLVNYFQRLDVPITVRSLAGHRSDASVLVPMIQNLQYYNTKVKYILQSSQYIRDHFNGIVPNTEKELLQLPGIGPLFADLLSMVNTIEMHEQYILSNSNNYVPRTLHRPDNCN